LQGLRGHHNFMHSPQSEQSPEAKKIASRKLWPGKNDIPSNTAVIALPRAMADTPVAVTW